ncbi:MAG: hypothetical protein JWN26_270 [Candidatus Saccharibacteria bacterium]|nr:hypothetical protein [Candidatus Saccharibacteria bacterium]
MDTDAPVSDVESVTMSDILQLTSTWDRPRTTEELLGFIARREAAITEINE